MTKSKPSKSTRLTAGELSAWPAARPGVLPQTIKPQLATLASNAPVGDEWLHEIKYDGYRLLCRISEGRVRLFTRRGNDWSDRFPAIARACQQLRVDDTLLDGEVVALRQDGTTDFQALQNSMRHGGGASLVYYAFDLPFLQGHDLKALPLIQRKELLSALLSQVEPASVVRYSDHIIGRGPEVFAQACQNGAEGIIAKKVSSPYEPRRTRTWLKIKCLLRREFVIGGWTDPSGSRSGFGALLLGCYEDTRLIYCGRAGTGFTARSLEELQQLLDTLATKRCPFAKAPRERGIRGVHWVQPQLVAEVEFTEWTGDGRLRHPSFKGLRPDRAAEDVRRGPTD